MSITEYILIDFDRIETTTAKAVLFIIEDDEVWIPKSVIDPGDDPHELSRGDEEGSVGISEWFAEKEGLV